SYFSNFIEGTVFMLEEARQIVETQQPLPARHGDSYDVLGTYRLVADRKEMQVKFDSPGEMLDLLQRRHQMLLSARLEKQPGQFKMQNNRAGETYFVDFQLVRGTLIKSFDFYRALQHPFARCAYLMFVISEVHPFLDGNGRLARVMMNAELVREGQAKILIPTVFREDYLLALRRLSRQLDPDPYVRMLERAHGFSEMVSGEDWKEMEAFLRSRNAFLESSEGRLIY
ncbi:MAG: Fic family protein, partial [Bacteroidota bacterium]